MVRVVSTQKGATWWDSIGKDWFDGFWEIGNRDSLGSEKFRMIQGLDDILISSHDIATKDITKLDLVDRALLLEISEEAARVLERAAVGDGAIGLGHGHKLGSLVYCRLGWKGKNTGSRV
jgi:hypothetical protein